MEPMNLREMARKLGGDDLLKIVDKEGELQKDFTRKLFELFEAEIAKADTNEAELLTNVAMVEALSTAYASAAICLGKMKDIPHGELLTLSIRSLVGNLETLKETLAAKEAGVEDLITGAAKKHGPLPTEE